MWVSKEKGPKAAENLRRTRVEGEVLESVLQSGKSGRGAKKPKERIKRQKASLENLDIS